MALIDRRSDKHRLLDMLMVAYTTHDLRHYVTAQRADKVAWRIIARQVTDITGRDITEPSLISWFGDIDKTADGAGARP